MGPECADAGILPGRTHITPYRQTLMNRVLAHCGARYPIVQAPMGWIARAALASAVSRAGGLGIIETSSGETEACQAEIAKMRELGLPFGVNLPIRFLKDDAMLRFVCTSGVQLRHHLGRQPGQVHRAAARRRHRRLSRRAHAGGGAEMRGRRHRRPGGRGRRRRRLQEPRGGVDAGTAAGHPRACRRAADRGRWHRRRPRHGRGLRAGRRGHPDGHALRQLQRKPGACALQAGHRDGQRHRHLGAEHEVHTLHPRTEDTIHRRHPRAGPDARGCLQGHSFACTSAATWRPRRPWPGNRPG